MNRLLIILYITILFLYYVSVNVPSTVAEEVVNDKVDNCWRITEISGQFYWSEQFHNNISELARNKESVIWSNNDNPGYCYSTTIDDINDKTEQLLAYYDQLTYLQAQFYRHDERGKKIDAVYSNIEKITGIKFNSLREFIIWFSTTSKEARNRIFTTSDAVSYWYFGQPYLEFDANDEFYWCKTKTFYAHLYCEKTTIEDINDPESQAVANINRVEFYLDMFRCNLLRKKQERLNDFNTLVKNNFETMTEFLKWWDENKEYLFWSENTKKLVVDEQAIKLNKPLRKFEPDIINSEQMTAEEFWYEHIVGNYSQLIDEGNVYRICISLPHSPGSKTILKSLVDYRNSKEKAFKKALGEKIDRYSVYPEEQQLLPPNKFNSPISSITNRLLEEKFTTTEELFAWYYDNKDKLVLSEDGEKLVVKEPSD